MTAQPYLCGMEADATRVNVDAKQKALSQWYTPPELAARVWAWMWREYAQDLSRVRRSAQMRVLEPSVGEGALLRPIIELGFPCAEVVAYDIDPANCEYVERKYASAFAGHGVKLTVRCGDFLADADPGHFDICVENPPYEDNADVAFAARTLELCTYVGGIFAVRMQASESRADFWRMTDIRREVTLGARPRFGGGFTPMTDFCVLDLAKRKTARKPGETCVVRKEWW